MPLESPTMFKYIVSFALAAVFTTAPAQLVLFYGGDSDGRNGLSCERNGNAESWTYDDFTVPEPGWLVRRVFGHFLMSDGFDGIADFEIRRGLSNGNAGTLVASGMNLRTVAARTGQVFFGLDEWIVEIQDVNVQLDAGTYHISLRPVGGVRSFLPTTDGRNGAGGPLHNGNAFFTSPTFRFNYAPVEDLLGKGIWDFSLGLGGVIIGGEIVPEAFAVPEGALNSGGLLELAESDDRYVVIIQRPPSRASSPSIRLVVFATAPSESASYFEFNFEAGCSGFPPANVPQRLELYNFASNSWEQVDQRPPTFHDSVVTVAFTSDAGRFIQRRTRLISSRMSWFDRGAAFANWASAIDHALWRIGR